MTLNINKEVVVEAGGRINFSLPELPVGKTVRIQVSFEAVDEESLLNQVFELDERSYESNQDIVAFLRKERDSWES